MLIRLLNRKWLPDGIAPAEGSISYEQGQADLNSYRVHANVRVGDGGFLIQ
jgi:hypothetical protein